MKHLKLYEEYNNFGFITDYDEAVQWLEENWYNGIDTQFNSSKLTKNNDGTFDYDGNVSLGSKDKKIDRIAVKFNHVTGDFDCSANNLVTLEGSPRRVGGRFNCADNNLVTLEGAPRHVGVYFGCGSNMLTTPDSKYSLWFENPGSVETDITKIAENFLKKLKTEERCKGHEGRILKALKQYKPEVYKVVKNVADFDLDYWQENLTKATKHKDILDL